MNIMLTLLLGTLALTPLSSASRLSTISENPDDPEVFGVYVKLAANIEAPFDDVVAELGDAIRTRGWGIVANYPVGVDSEDCVFRGHTFVINVPDYVRRVLDHGTVGAFALPVRVTVTQDEMGVHVTAANPQSLTRTIISETAFRESAREMVDLLGNMVAETFSNHAVREQYGQMRREGLIRKTMGIIAGGEFGDKVETVASTDLRDGETLADLAERLYRGLDEMAGDWKWQTRPVYLLNIPEYDVAIVGVTSDAIEAKSFDIVRHGGDDSRRNMMCPGMDHAAAYPIEVVLVRDGDRANVMMIDEMFRMKMYFEDAGRMKFAANMRMPGSIENEIRDKIEDSLHRLK